MLNWAKLPHLPATLLAKKLNSGFEMGLPQQWAREELF